MTLTEISDALWQERRLTEKLVYKLDTVSMLVESGRWRWLVMLADEAKEAADELVVHRLRWSARTLGGGARPTAPDPALQASSPRNEILADHDVALAQLRRELRGAARTAIATLSRHLLVEPIEVAGEDDELAAEVFRIAVDGLLAVAHAASSPCAA
jgi:hypothetical protein